MLRKRAFGPQEQRHEEKLIPLPADRAVENHPSGKIRADVEKPMRHSRKSQQAGVFYGEKAAPKFALNLRHIVYNSLAKSKAGVARLVERNLAKVEVADSNPVSSSIGATAINIRILRPRVRKPAPPI